MFISLRLTLERSKSESLRDVTVTKIGNTFPTVFRRLHRTLVGLNSTCTKLEPASSRINEILEIQVILLRK